jgi:uncharacterized protein (DUF1778 family)
LKGDTLTEFLVKSASAAADDALANRTHFVLSEKEWSRFVEALDRPAREVPGLRRLFQAKSPFIKE